MKINVENFTINLHRAEESSCQDEIRRLANYVHTICELGQHAKNQKQRIVDNLENPEKGKKNVHKQELR